MTCLGTSLWPCKFKTLPSIVHAADDTDGSETPLLCGPVLEVITYSAVTHLLHAKHSAVATATNKLHTESLASFPAAASTVS